MNQTKTISHKITRKMTLQVCLIAIVAVLGIAVSSVVIEQFLVRQALENEAKHFWYEYGNDLNFPAPNTDNLKGYLTAPNSLTTLPVEFTEHGVGYHDLPDRAAHSLLYITEKGDKRLYLLFDGKSVGRLAIYFGILPLTVVLVLIYITSWWVYRESTHLFSPIVWLAEKFDKFDPAHPDAVLVDISEMPGDIDWEVEKLANSISLYSHRIKQFVERERAFTRDASHEFRTPLTVIKMAASMLLAESDLDQYATKHVKRIRESALNMEELIEAFLVLARETDSHFETEPIDIVELLEQEKQDIDVLLLEKDVEVKIQAQSPLVLEASNQVLSVIFGNLLRNAVLYTDEGLVTMTIQRNQVQIKDTGIGMESQQIERIFQPHYRGDHGSTRKGYGVGLTIVKRLVDRLGWELVIESEPDIGTSVTVRFL